MQDYDKIDGDIYVAGLLGTDRSFPFLLDDTYFI